MILNIVYEIVLYFLCISIMCHFFLWDFGRMHNTQDGLVMMPILIRSSYHTPFPLKRVRVDSLIGISIHKPSSFQLVATLWSVFSCEKSLRKKWHRYAAVTIYYSMLSASHIRLQYHRRSSSVYSLLFYYHDNATNKSVNSIIESPSPTNNIIFLDTVSYS